MVRLALFVAFLVLSGLGLRLATAEFAEIPGRRPISAIRAIRAAGVRASSALQSGGGQTLPERAADGPPLSAAGLRAQAPEALEKNSGPLALQTVQDAKVTTARDGARLSLANNRVRVVLLEEDGTWEAEWHGKVTAALGGARFAIEIDQREETPVKVKAEASAQTDAIGSGMEIRQRWGQGVEIVRSIRLYDDRPAVVVSARITNNSSRDVSLGTAKLLTLSEGDQGWWHLASRSQIPAAVGYPGATPACRPSPDGEPSAGVPPYVSAGVLALVQPHSPGGLSLGLLSAHSGAPAVRATFQAGAGGTLLEAVSAVSRILKPGEAVDLDPVWLSVEDDRYDILDRYGDAVAAMSSEPVRTGANALWCSWYPIRMTVSEEIALEHGAIAAEHFRPLGLEVIQLDHGWQRGDICGDWYANERFPHGLKWLSEQLQSRHGMKLGLWIAPTNVAFTSQLFRDHPEWLITNADGKPASTGRWFWEPHPEMTLIDASHPGAERWIEETFRRLTSEGAGYYKIDFIAGSPSLRRAMAAIRRGAGSDAWIRYCQTPPLLSAGLASSAYIGMDTGDAGLKDWMQLEVANAPLLAASYWVNDRLYHREVCDMSVGRGAGVEEARFKISLMTLSGCSISFSDDFRALQLPRIRMMQQCLPPGNPPARPLDLFERETPSLWHMHCRGAAGEWDAVGVFNFDDQPRQQTVDLTSLNIPADAPVAVFEFWNEEFLGVHRRSITLPMAPRTARILLIHRLPDRPEVIGTNMHLLGGYHEIRRLTWNADSCSLAGFCHRMPGVSGRVYFYVPEGYRPLGKTQGATVSTPTHLGGPIWSLELQFDKADAPFELTFEHSGD